MQRICFLRCFPDFMTKLVTFCLEGRHDFSHQTPTKMYIFSWAILWNRRLCWWFKLMILGVSKSWFWSKVWVFCQSNLYHHTNLRQNTCQNGKFRRGATLPGNPFLDGQTLYTVRDDCTFIVPQIRSFYGNAEKSWCRKNNGFHFFWVQHGSIKQINSYIPTLHMVS